MPYNIREQLFLEIENLYSDHFPHLSVDSIEFKTEVFNKICMLVDDYEEAKKILKNVSEENEKNILKMRAISNFLLAMVSGDNKISYVSRKKLTAIGDEWGVNITPGLIRVKPLPEDNFENFIRSQD